MISIDRLEELRYHKRHNVRQLVHALVQLKQNTESGKEFAMNMLESLLEAEVKRKRNGDGDDKDNTSGK